MFASCITRAELRSCDRDCVTCEAENTALYKKRPDDPCFEVYLGKFSSDLGEEITSATL